MKTLRHTMIKPHKKAPQSFRAWSGPRSTITLREYTTNTIVRIFDDLCTIHLRYSHGLLSIGMMLIIVPMLPIVLSLPLSLK